MPRILLSRALVLSSGMAEAVRATIGVLARDPGMLRMIPVAW